MSTFRGIVKEIPGISIDCFDEDNLLSSAFFFSSYCEDHRKGLNSQFFSRLKTKSQYLYCSHISKSFLKTMFTKCDTDIFDKHVIELPLDDSRIVEYVHINNFVTFTVSCISSGHSPGSVMFLFKVKGKNILYTGDFRIDKKDCSKLKSLHCTDTLEYPLSLDKIYLDTTFLDLNFNILPSRLSSVKQLCVAVKDWLGKNPKNIVLLEISAACGTEFIFMELFKLLKEKIHVTAKMYELYSKIQMLADSVTNISENTRIHACMKKMDIHNLQGLKCRSDVDVQNILTVVPSVEKWISEGPSTIIEWDDSRKQIINVCYSTHASYEELVTFIEYFKPKDVFPCVCNVNNKKKMYELLQKIMTKYKNDEVPEESYALSISKYRMGNAVDFKSAFFSDEED